MSDEKRAKYFMTADKVEKLAGRTIKEIRREGEAIFIELTDGTGMEISNDRPIPARLMIYHWRKSDDTRS
jgi:hypothetical protein